MQYSSGEAEIVLYIWVFPRQFEWNIVREGSGGPQNVDWVLV